MLVPTHFLVHVKIHPCSCVFLVKITNNAVVSFHLCSALVMGTKIMKMTREPPSSCSLWTVCGKWQCKCVCVCLVLQARPTSVKEGKGLVNCVYKPCPTALCSAIHSHCSILSYDALCHCLSSNSSLENGKRELGHLFCYSRRCKNTWTILLRKRAYSATGNSRLHYLKCGNVIQLIAFRWDTTVHQTLPFFSGSGSGLWD